MVVINYSNVSIVSSVKASRKRRKLEISNFCTQLLPKYDVCVVKSLHTSADASHFFSEYFQIKVIHISSDSNLQKRLLHDDNSNLSNLSFSCNTLELEYLKNLVPSNRINWTQSAKLHACNHDYENNVQFSMLPIRINSLQ